MDDLLRAETFYLRNPDWIDKDSSASESRCPCYMFNECTVCSYQEPIITITPRGIG